MSILHRYDAINLILANQWVFINKKYILFPQSYFSFSSYSIDFLFSYSLLSLCISFHSQMFSNCNEPLS